MSEAPIILNDGQALVVSAELIPIPDAIVRHSPAAAGTVAAAHALVDVFAAGAELMIAAPVVVQPDELSDADLATLWEAIGDVVEEVGGQVGQGRLLRGEQLLVGASVVGLVAPGKELAPSGAEAGDLLLLSKPIGTGIVAALGDERERAGVVDGMGLTDRIAARRLLELGSDCHGVIGVKDGGLLGHAHDLADASRVQIVVDSALVPCYRGAKRLATERRRVDRRSEVGGGLAGLAGDDGVGEPEGVVIDGRADTSVAALALEPQTSGGLLAAVVPGALDALVEAGFRPVGTVVDADAGEEWRVRLV